MEWMENERTGGVRRIVVIENDAAFVRALNRALPFSICALLISENDSISDILNVLQNKSTINDTALYLDAQLVYKECPNPSYYGGLELIQHIRLTPSLEPISILPIIVGTIDVTARLIQQEASNVIIFSPGCDTVKLPASLADLHKALQCHQPFSDYKQVRDAIKPFVWMTKRDIEEKQRWEHVYRNRDGVLKFLTEFAGLSEDDDKYKHYKQQFSEELWFKKAQFLQSEQGPESVGVEGSNKRTEMQDLINRNGYKFIYIDDEHWLGWSYGLYKGLTGCTDTSDLKLFDNGRDTSSIKTPNERLLCISRFDEAEQLFEGESKKLEETLKEHARLKWQKLLEQIMVPPACDLVFLDLRLEREDEDRPYKELSGVKLLKQIKANFPDLPVIIMSASRDIRSGRETRRLGADGYWIKDISTGEELIDNIIRCLEKSELKAVWRAIRLVEEQKEITCYEREGSSWKDRKLPKEVTTWQKLNWNESQKILEKWLDRNLIQIWLRESFYLLRVGEEIRDSTFHDEDYPYDRVILNMGLIQETRLKGLVKYGQDTDESDKWFRVPFKKCEQKLHNRRNEMAHPYKRVEEGLQQPDPATRQEVIGFLKFTLNRLLGKDFFNIRQEFC